MHLNDCEVFLFGSYLNAPLEANDIDILLVVPDLSEIEDLYIELKNFKDKNPQNSIHIIIYTIDEYKNSENKFSYVNVKTRINLDDLAKLYKVRLTKT